MCGKESKTPCGVLAYTLLCPNELNFNFLGEECKGTDSQTHWRGGREEQVLLLPFTKGSRESRSALFEMQ